MVARIAAAALAIAAASCAAVAPPPVAPVAPIAPASAPAVSAAPWGYAVVTGPEALELAIEAAIPPGPARVLSVDDGTEPFVRDVEIIAPGGERAAIEASEAVWRVPACPAGPPRRGASPGCRIRYRFLLDQAARAHDSIDYAQDLGGALISPPSAWLLRPVDGQGDPDATRFTLRVSTPPGLAFVTGLFHAPSDPGAFEASLADLINPPYSAFGPIELRRVEVGGGAIQVALLPGAIELGEDALLGWVTDAARSVAGYYGRYPVEHALVLITPTRGKGPGFASALGNGGASIMARVGRATTREDLAESWVMTHEMLHLAFPNLERQHSWLEEGLATYVEPIARARLGMIAVDEVWRDLAFGLPKGLPMEGDRGLDNTPTWGRTYWGGALFCLLADLEIRERTGNTRSLDDALRGILAAGGDIAVRWEIGRALAEGDRATGVPVLTELYARMKDAPADVDLDALFRRLGVRFVAGQIRFDDGAPLAGVRASITERAGATAAATTPAGPLTP